MEAEFWLNKWAINQIGFHEAAPHPLLTAHFAALGLAAGSRVFVPLCGKSNDLLWLREAGFEVVGIELSAIAVEDFFSDNGLAPQTSVHGALKRYVVPGITLYCGDYFALTAAELGRVDGVYDRAALIALEAEQRAAYVRHLDALCNTSTAMLLITVDYDREQISPPPFVVEADEIARLYEARWEREVLDTAAAEVKGIAASETAWQLRRISHAR